MSEQSEQLLQVFKLIWIIGYCALYGYGGIEHKELRRIYGSLWLCAGICLFSALSHTFSWWFLLIAPLYYGASTYGYGVRDDNLLEKILKRMVQGLLFTIAALPVFIVMENWGMFGIHAGLCLLFCTLLGVFGFTKSARKEETAIALAVSVVPLLTV